MRTNRCVGKQHQPMTRASRKNPIPDAARAVEPRDADACKARHPGRGWVPALGVFLAAALVRLLLMEPHLTSYDFLKYPTLAAKLIGEGSREPFNAAPLYIYFWVLMHHLFDYNTYWPRVVQLLGGAVGCVAIYAAGSRLFDRRVGLIAGLAAALYAPLIAHDGIYLSECLVVLLNAAALAVLLRARDDGRGWLWALGGILIGLSAITRPNVLLWLPWVVAWVVLDRAPGTPARRAWARAAVVAAGAGLLLALIVARNYRVSGDPVLVMSDGGIVFYIANNRLDQGPSYIWPRSEALFELGQLDPTHRIARETASRILGRELTHSESSRFWMQQGLEFIRAEPMRYLWLTWRKFVYYWRDYEVPDTMAQHVAIRSLRALPLLTFGMVAPLGVLGMALGLRRWRRHLLLYGLIATYLVTALAFGVESRYRLPMMPALLPLAGFAAFELARAARERRWRALAPGLLLVALVAWGSNSRDFLVWKMETRMQVVRELFDPGAVLVHQRRYAEAIPLLGRVVAESPVYETLADAHTLLAECYAALGDRERAAEEIRLSLGPLCWEDAPYPVERSRMDLAQDAREDPRDVESRQLLGYLAWKSGEHEEAVRWFREVTDRTTSHAAGHLNLGVNLAALGRTREAERELRLAADLMPQLEPARIGLADLLEKQGRWKEAGPHWEDLARMRPHVADYRERLERNRLRDTGPAGEPHAP